MAVHKISTKEIDDYKNIAHKIFCGGEAYLFAAINPGNHSLNFFNGKNPINSNHPQAVSKALKDKSIILSYYGIYLSSAGSTNQAFALELYFKCLYFIDNGALLRGHKLKDELFDNLSLERQQTIENYFNDLKKSDHSFQEAITEQKELDISFNEALTSSSNAFVNLRYVFEIESSKMSSNFLINIIYATRKLILEIHPEWPSIMGFLP